MKEQLITRANECFDRYIDKYYQKGVFEKADFWDTAEIFEIIDDAYEITGDQKYADFIEETYTAFINQNGPLWESNIYNDDIMWAVIAMSRAYKLTSIQKYYDTAKANLDYVWERALSDDFGGGLWWRTDKQCKNACVNCPGVIAACLIGEISGEESYFEKAKDIMEWTVKTLANEETGKIYDAINLNGEVNQWSSTYNQGTYIGGNMLLYRHFGDEVYKNRAAAAASFTMNEMYHGGIMDNEDWGNDVIGFKAILSRWLRLYALAENKPEYIEWLRKNADSAYSNRNAEGIMMTKFATKTEEIYYDVFGTSAAVGVMFNCI